MDSVNPVLECIWFVEEGIRRGESVQEALMRWAEASASTPASANIYGREFRLQVLQVLRKMEGHSGPEVSALSTYRDSLFQILIAGFRGEAVLSDLLLLKSDIQNQLDLDMKSHVETLPFKMLIPLLLFLFPSFLILLFGPITRSFLHAL